jgi:hypothetical protein
VLERVHAAVLDRGLVDRRQVPKHQVHRPERESDEGVREDAQPHDPRKREQRSEHRPGQPGEQAERGEVADEEVLGHVEREQLLLADPRDRRRDRSQEEHEAECEERDPPAGDGLAALGERPRADAVRHGDEPDGRQLQQDHGGDLKAKSG